MKDFISLVIALVLSSLVIIYSALKVASKEDDRKGAW